MSDAISRSESRPKKRRLRASRACDQCHGRKVRCDITQTAPGDPCTNCRLDRHACVSYSGSRTRPSRSGSSQAPEIWTDSFGKPGEPASNLQLQLSATKAPSSAQRPLLGNSLPVPDIVGSLNFRITDLWMGQMFSQHNNIPGFTAAADVESQYVNGGPDGLKAPRPRFNDGYNPRGLDEHILFSYYDFLALEKLPTIEPGDARFLEFNGSLHVPMRPILDEFVKEYFLHVHPGLPFLDERTFWTAYERSGGEAEKPNRISLFLFQAMLCCSCSFISLNILRRCGFESTRQARKVFYRRAKSLFDFDLESDFFSIAQGSLLLTYYVSDTDPHVNSYWLGVAIQNAKTVNAQLYHRDQTQSSQAIRAKKRLWWCCIVRDRVLPLGVRRPIQITPDHFDFTNSRITEGDLQDQVGWSRVYDLRTQKLLIKMFVTECELAVQLTQLMMTVYPLDGSSPAPSTSPEGLTNTEVRISRQKGNLVNWFTKFSLWMCETDSRKDNASVILFSHLLYIYYHSARLALCHYEVLVIDPLALKNSDQTQRMEMSKIDMQTATDAITESIKILLQHKLAQYMPISAVAYTALPLVLTALDLRLSSDMHHFDGRRRDLEVYVEVMKLYQKKYDGTDQVSSIIEKILSDAESQTSRIRTSQSLVYRHKNLVPAGRSKNWGDIFREHPRFHLRLTLAIDFSFSRGRFPQDSELPKECRVAQLDSLLLRETAMDDTTPREQDAATIITNLLSPTWSVNDRSPAAPAHLHDDSRLNLDFIDLFGDHDTTSGHGWVEDEVQDLFDYSVPA